ncbi:23S rRNA (uracil(1939)-C(5))-methyltransferase RlmD [Eisenibacter elegans]|uniref:23S rRNA (uracil(1939)-C(5))-methyltransferase RlmD n=1 Tax=Eisenibacter elegans TaxID=997 RepID=UPI0004196945|nr:23S rRNA (uracil(1939)-C(5))-methyltransferase RlmD [Eisenibacter elegans]
MKKKPLPLLQGITIEGFAAEGKCIARHEGRVIFVEGNQAAPQDVVDLQVLRKRKSYWEAAVVAIHQASPQRTEPFCQHFGTCGGCKWQHIPYEVQLAQKQQQVWDNFTKIGKLDFPAIRPILPSVDTQYYRNKLEYTFSSRRWLTAEEVAQGGDNLSREALGFHIPKRFDRILDIEHCYLQADPSNAIRLAIRAYALEHQLSFFDQKEQTGWLRNLIIRTASTGDLMVILIVSEEQPEALEALLAHLQAQFPQISSLQYVINGKRNDSIHDLSVQCYAGQPYIEEQMTSLSGQQTLRFRIGPQSFYQTNAAQAERLYRVAGEMAQLSGQECVYDLYTGTGTIACFVADQAAKVVGVEYVEAAIEDAKRNAALNGINHTHFFAGDMKDVLTDEFVHAHGTPDVIITDPPRAGMHTDVVEMLLRIAPKRIVYVSCNPATQARDLALLQEAYAIEAVQPVDMFPHTHHVECVVALQKR